MNEISSSERVWAAIGHWAALFGFLPLPFINVAGPLLVFIMERDESAYAAFHAKQSLYLQVVVEVVVWAGMILGLLVFWMIAGLLGTQGPWWLSFLVVSLWYVLRLAAVLYAVLAGIKVYQGVNFEYVVVGHFARTH